MSRRALAASVALVVLALDQITKIWAVATLEDGPIVIVEDILRLALARNPGASFSTFTNAGQLIGLIAIGVVVAVFVLVDRVTHRIDLVGLGLIMGGAAGNLADRIFRGEGFLDGAVVDFVDFTRFPSFNVADAAINIGVALLLIGTFVVHRRGDRDEAETTDATDGDEPQNTDAAVGDTGEPRD